MAKSRTEGVDSRASLQAAQDIVQNQGYLGLVLLLVADLAVDQPVDHRVVVVVLDVEVLLDEARGHVVVDRVGDDVHVVEVLVAVEALVQEQVVDDGALARLDG